jgi:hypothetical protein
VVKQKKLFAFRRACGKPVDVTGNLPMLKSPGVKAKSLREGDNVRLEALFFRRVNASKRRA